jgi:hypothetical protein
MSDERGFVWSYGSPHVPLLAFLDESAIELGALPAEEIKTILSTSWSVRSKVFYLAM